MVIGSLIRKVNENYISWRDDRNKARKKLRLIIFCIITFNILLFAGVLIFIFVMFRRLG